MTVADSTVQFEHANFSLNDDGSIESVEDGDFVTSTFPVKIIENDLIRVTVLPEYGGRILSIIYKPTGHEMLYQNPVAAPFGVDQGYFYYDWLMVYGGIFPTFPEAEHGKAWYLPWSSEIVEQGGDEVAIRMTFADDIEPAGSVPPERFGYGRTNLTVVATVRVRRGSSAVTLDLSLVNDRDNAVAYEYWTCTTLTPGSTPGATASPSNTEMIVPIEEVFSTYGWVGDVEQGTGDSRFRFDHLRTLEAWSDAGILYAYPRMDADFWGVINHDNEVGIFRIADSAITPGLKFWTWGADSVNSNPDEADERRPYIELWAGHSTRFFQAAEIAANHTISWTESYVPTVGLSDVTNANEFVSAFLDTSPSGGSVEFSASLFSAVPSVDLEITLFLDNGTRRELLTETWAPDPLGATPFTVLIPASDLDVGDDVGVTVETGTGELLFETTTTYSP